MSNVFTLQCDAEEDDGLKVTHDTETESWCFELTGSKDPVFFTNEQIDELVTWLKNKQDLPKFDPSAQ